MEKKKWLRSESAQSFQNGGRLTEGGFLVFMGILLLLVVIVVVIAVVSSVAGAAAAIVDDEDSEDE